jgi:hypothetical protein
MNYWKTTSADFCQWQSKKLMIKRPVMKKTLASLLLVTLFAANVTRPQATKNPQHFLVVRGDLPLYPRLAWTARVGGSVRVQVTVKDGEVAATEVISGHPLLAPATTGNIQTWKFDKKTNATFTTTFTYQLEKEETAEASNPKIELELPTLVKITARPIKPPCQDCGVDLIPKVIDH